MVSRSGGGADLSLLAWQPQQLCVHTGASCCLLYLCMHNSYLNCVFVNSVTQSSFTVSGIHIVLLSMCMRLLSSSYVLQCQLLAASEGRSRVMHRDRSCLTARCQMSRRRLTCLPAEYDVTAERLVGHKGWPSFNAARLVLVYVYGLMYCYAAHR
eukprot:GHRQ01038577.1.p1 GENE.GHRQ01038577.1~~GHRQ01038577.1.p1  ORF type:complete len:155 (-),score=23.23 GHRQ01038577.1:571-1035(-)